MYWHRHSLFNFISPKWGHSFHVISLSERSGFSLLSPTLPNPQSFRFPSNFPINFLPPALNFLTKKLFFVDYSRRCLTRILYLSSLTCADSITKGDYHHSKKNLFVSALKRSQEEELNHIRRFRNQNILSFETDRSPVHHLFSLELSN